VIVPFLTTLGISLSNEKDISDFGYRIFPARFDLSAYRFIFKNPKSIISAYRVTAVSSVAGTFLSVLLTAMAAYPLSKRALPCRYGFSLYFYFTMLFGGGMAPTYILLTQYLRLGDTIWVYILPGLISPWYVFLMRTFFQGLPEEMLEAAHIDGASEYQIFFRMVLPLSKPVIATVALFGFLLRWNDWTTALLYIDNQNLVSLQYLLQRIMRNLEILQNFEAGGGQLVSAAEIPSETVRMAMAVVVAGPALAVFPFFQKYFVKGLTVGSVKG
jgi:putative aldouronate transport system permease protein